MDIGNQHNDFSINPLTSISPRPVNTSNASSNTPSLSEDSDASAQDQQQKRLNQKRAEQATDQQNDRIVQQLVARDREVRAHEAAHAAAGGSYVTSGPSFIFQKGPNGRSYAIGGEVSIDASKVSNNPEATLRKSEVVRRAALAPAQPSPQDFRVAAKVAQTAAQARIEIAVLKAEEAERVLQERNETVEQLSNDESSIDSATSDSQSTESNTTDSKQANNVATIPLFDDSDVANSTFSLFA